MNTKATRQVVERKTVQQKIEQDVPMMAEIKTETLKKTQEERKRVHGKRPAPSISTKM